MTATGNSTSGIESDNATLPADTEKEQKFTRLSSFWTKIVGGGEKTEEVEGFDRTIVGPKITQWFQQLKKKLGFDEEP
jgi:hypothetical protein